MPYLTLPTGTIYYAPHRGHPWSALLIHGAGSTHRDWPAQLRRLPDTAVYALDLPGHGRSTAPTLPTIAAYAHTLLTAVSQLACPPPLLIGHSMGSAIALEMALQADEGRIAGMVLIGAGAHLPVADALLNGLQHDFAATTANLARYFWPKGTPESIIARSRDNLRQNPPETVYADFRACQQFDIRPQLPQVRVPSLIIGSPTDKMTPFALSEYLAAHLPQAQLLSLPQAGHMMHLERGAEVATAVSQFQQQL